MVWLRTVKLELGKIGTYILQISAVCIGYTWFNHKKEVKCWEKIVRGNYYLGLLAIFKRKHIVKMNSNI